MRRPEEAVTLDLFASVLSQFRGIMWHPILQCGDDHDMAAAAIAEVAAFLSKQQPASTDPIEMSEIALLFAFLSQSRNEEYRTLAISLTESAIDNASEAARSFALFGGIAGLAWNLNLCIRLLCDDDVSSLDPDPLAELDANILRVMEHPAYDAVNYDLISGQVGVGVYWLDRLPRADAQRGLRLVLTNLQETALPDSVGVSWFTPKDRIPSSQKKDAPDGYYNLGLAHGVPGVIAFLSRVIQESPGLSKIASQLLDGALNWLNRHRRSMSSGSVYSSWILPKQRASELGESRIGWCYGDVGIAAALQLAFGTTHDSLVRIKSNELLDRASVRPARLKESSLCHGALGVAHVYNRSFQRTSDTFHLECAKAFYRQALQMRNRDVSPEHGFCQWDPSTDTLMPSGPSYLTGLTGIALALYAAVGTFDPVWDRRLLLSGRL